MRASMRLGVVSAWLASCLSGSVVPATDDSKTVSPDSTKAVRPTEMKMATYYVASLRRGPQWTAEMTPEVTKILEGHFAHITRLANLSVLSLAGPFLEQSGEGALAGMFVFHVPSADSALALAKQDPGVMSGRFTVEMVPWLAPEKLATFFTSEATGEEE